jgi:M6 family metalloprotease-like protein
MCTVLLLIAGFSNKSFAVTADPNPVEYRQPDGTIITLMLKGDEFIHWATTTDGYTILSNSSGTYVYGEIDPQGMLTFSSVQANDPANRTAAELAFLKTIQPGLFFSPIQLNEMRTFFNRRKNGNTDAVMSAGFPTTGTRKLLMILANFSNTTTTYTQSDFNNYMNQVNYNGTGSFRDFYLEVSYGLLTVNTTVTVWVTVPNTHDYYGPDANWGIFAHDAVVAANNQTSVNFAEFDNGGDGIVDGVAIIHQGRGQEESGNTNDIWSHSWSLSDAGFTAADRTFDGVLVDAYTTMPERNASGMGAIGVMCHEFGHNLGSPDFYDTDYNNTGNGNYPGTGRWDVMAGGSWNGASGTKPAHHNAWTKGYFGWTNPVTLTASQSVLLRNAQVYTDAVRYNTTTANEYYLCENRQQTGFDVGLPGHGLIIYHVDGNYVTSHMGTNNINVNLHQGLYPMSANSGVPNGIELASGSTINTPGCPWPGTGSKTTFTDATTPCSKSWAGANTGKPLSNITENTSTKEITFCYIACPNPLDPGSLTAVPSGTTQIDLSWSKNSTNDPVMLAFNTSPTFGTPVNGTTYSAGNAISGGGTVLYNGTNTAFSHQSLTPGTVYYYKAWSVTTGTNYSPGISANASTLCSVISTFPYSEGFEHAGAMPNCWTQQLVSGSLQWSFIAGDGQGHPTAAHTGSYNALFYEGAYGVSNITKLVSPAFNIAPFATSTLSFWHTQAVWGADQDYLRVYYKTSPAGTWTLLASYTASITAWTQVSIVLPNPSSAYYIAFEGEETWGYGVCIDDISITNSGNAPTLNVKAFFEGPYNNATGLMTTALASGGNVPLSQPFNVAPWNYPGTESVASIPANVTDWVLVEFRTDTTAATMVARRAYFVKNNGQITGLNGTDLPVLSGISAGSYYIVLRQQNHLSIMSSAAVPLNAASTLYDFTTSSAKSYKGLEIQLQPGVWGLYSGDADADNTIQNSDFIIWRNEAGSNGILKSDFDLDGTVQNSDFIIWRNNAGTSAKVPN